MDEIMKMIFHYAPMNGACNKIMKKSIHDFQTWKSEMVIEYYNGFIDIQELDNYMNLPMYKYYLE